MIDPTTQQIGVGGLVAVLLVGTVLKFLPAFMTALKSNTRNGPKTAGQLDPAEWEQRIGKIVEDKIHGSLAGRNEDLRRIIREELERQG